MSRFKGFFALFPWEKSAEVAGQVSAHLPRHVSSWTPAAHAQPRASDEEEEDELLAVLPQLRGGGRGRRGGSGDFLVPFLGLRGSSGGDSRLRVRGCRLRVGFWLPQHSANSVLDCAFLVVFVVEGGYIHVDMSEHTCGEAFDATVPEVAVDMLRYCAENCGDSAVAVYQHHRRLPCRGAEAIPSSIPQVAQVDVPVVFFHIPVVAQRHFPWSRLLCGLRFHSCSWTRWSMCAGQNPCRGAEAVSHDLADHTIAVKIITVLTRYRPIVLELI